MTAESSSRRRRIIAAAATMILDRSTGAVSRQAGKAAAAAKKKGKIIMEIYIHNSIVPFCDVLTCYYAIFIIYNYTLLLFNVVKGL